MASTSAELAYLAVDDQQRVGDICRPGTSGEQIGTRGHEGRDVAGAEIVVSQY
jgi:hypothetical protein